MKRFPVAVIAGDIHYSLQTLPLADAATRQAISTANELDVIFIANGDTTDTKAILRAECVNAMIETFKTAKCQPIVNIGNHCRIHEKSQEHALNFLRPFANIIDVPKYIEHIGYVIPYYSDPNTLRQYLRTLPKNSQLIMHQGLQDSNSGDYIQDKSAINKDDVIGMRVIASHYHTRQMIPLKNGIWDYIGSPYTQSFGEANDLDKGYQILYDDGSLEFILTNLRRHIIVEYDVNEQGDVLPQPHQKINSNDLVWVKVRGPREVLSQVKKTTIASAIGMQDFRLDLIPLASIEHTIDTKPATHEDRLDSIVDSLTNTSQECKMRIKKIWRDLCD